MIIVGVDEVGRGCLVGNVVAGAVILPDDFYLPGLTDSKNHDLPLQQLKLLKSLAQLNHP
jgi:ribonuclease HII